MSRIDQALTIWEGDNATGAEQRPPASNATAALNQYPQEQADRPEHEQARPEPRVMMEPRETLDVPGDPAERHTTGVAKARTRPDAHARLVTTASNTVSVEQYRRVAAVLHDIQVEKQLKTVMITSAVPQEGKTLTVVNLALTLSESYARRVLILDADLRWPSVHRVLEVPNARGLSEALRDPGHELPI